MSNNESLFGEVVYSYTRADAIADGVLVDLSDIETVKTNWKCPLACTDTVWNLIERAIQTGKDIEGIMHDIAVCAQEEARRVGRRDVVYFMVWIGVCLHELKLHVGPGDTREPVMTLMLPCED